MAQAVPRPGSLVGGKYRVLRRLQSGGMATVLEAENEQTGKRVALKWIRPSYGEQPEAHARIVREAQATSRLRHPNVVDVYDVERDGDTLFLVMELLEGETLAAAMARDELPLHAQIGLLLPAMRGVAAAHRLGVVHRDIKPGNIFLARVEDSPHPLPKVLDFGISKRMAPLETALTETGISVGTLRYMSYEQLMGWRDVDARTDVYAFGAILYEMATGRLPFEADSAPSLAVEIATGTLVPPKALTPALPSELDRLIVRALARSRDERVPNLAELIAQLEPFASGPGVAPRALPTPAALPHAVPSEARATGGERESEHMRLTSLGTAELIRLITPPAHRRAAPLAALAALIAGSVLALMVAPGSGSTRSFLDGLAVPAAMRPDPPPLPDPLPSGLALPPDDARADDPATAPPARANAAPDAATARPTAAPPRRNRSRKPVVRTAPRDASAPQLDLTDPYEKAASRPIGAAPPTRPAAPPPRAARPNELRSDMF